MAKHSIPDDADSSELGDEDIQVPSVSKRPRKSRDDLSANEVLEERTRTVRQPSTKQQQIDLKNQERQATEVQSLRRQLKELKKLVAEGKTAASQSNAEDDNGERDFEHLPLESEEEDVTVSLHSAIRKGPSISMQTLRPPPLHASIHYGGKAITIPQRRETTVHYQRQHCETVLSSPSPHSSSHANGDTNTPSATPRITCITRQHVASSHVQVVPSPSSTHPQSSQPQVQPSSSSALAVDVTALKPALFRGGEQPAGRPKVHDYEDHAYHFVLGDKKSTERKNLQRYRELTNDSAFHYKNLDVISGARSGFTQHPYISELIQKAFFKNTRSLGVEFRKYFEPIPMVTIAFILTISANIDEWSTGKHVQAQFRESDHKDVYLNYLGDLQRWEKSAPQVVTNIRKKWHDRARRIAGAMADSVVNRSVSENAMKAAQLELQGRSGLTDSEDDSGAEGDMDGLA
ncbi:hypothetical protein A0H81_06562 [Grifola frondosa]|uniref:DUF6532 domain-containing protein n=1 Tax=Grifola frondosa TaxID=5627 RepID=A0A1C7M9M7_GRIFR|nr:hypothetical protein A0H81_06562 [Grifola frondosa]